MKPLIALDEVEKIFYVSDTPGPDLAKVKYYCVPKWILRLFNNNPAVRAAFKLCMVFYLAVFKRPDLLMGYSFTPHGINAALAGRILNIPSCIHVIGSIPSVEGGGIACGNNILLKMLKRSGLLEKALLAIARGSRFITVTGPHTRDYLISRGMRKDNIEILSSIVDTKRFFPVSVKKEYDLIAMAELIPSKRVDLFLEIVLRLKNSRIDIRAVILGEGPLRRQLEDKARRLGIGDNVCFAGFHTNVEGYLNKSRIFLMPTESEGLSLAMLEAMACGVVPVVSNVGDMADAVESGVNGMLAAKDDIEAFCSAVYKLLKDEEYYNNLSRSAIETIKRRYTIQDAGQKWHRILGAVAEARPKAWDWFFNRLKAMGPQEIAYRFIRLVRTKMLKLVFLWPAKRRYISAGYFREPKFFIDDKDMDFIKTRMKKEKPDITLPFLKDIDWHADACPGGDVKRRAGSSGVELAEIWGFNRFQWLTARAQKYAIDKDERMAEAARSIIEDWIEKNPVLKGINWMDPLEVSMRLLTWAYIYFLIRDSEALDSGFEDMFLRSVYCQARFVEENLSKYSSANNHLIGEAAGLFTIGVLFPQLKGSEKRMRLGKRILEEEITKQVYSDGAGKEQSMHYHEFITELYLIAVSLGKKNGIRFSEGLNSRLRDMCGFIMHMMGDDLRPLNIGDSDDSVGLRLNMLGQFSNSLSILNTASALFDDPEFKIDKNDFDEKSLWLLGREGYERYSALKPLDKGGIHGSKSFPEGGYYIARHKGLRLDFDCGQLGYLSLAGHGHADSLSFTLSVNGRHIFVDPGTYLYHSGNKWRDYFRGTAGHNTVRIDDMDQSEARGPFLWGYKARACLKHFSEDDRFYRITGYHTGYARLKDRVAHSREITLDKMNREITINDSISSKGRHCIEQFFHLHPDCSLRKIEENLFEVANKDARLLMEIDKSFNPCIFAGSESPIAGWYSDRFGEKQRSVTICNRASSCAGKNFTTKIIVSN